jgi:hypothetical protein
MSHFGKVKNMVFSVFSLDISNLGNFWQVLCHVAHQRPEFPLASEHLRRAARDAAAAEVQNGRKLNKWCFNEATMGYSWEYLG